MEWGTHSPDPASALRGRACVQPTQSDQGHREPFPADLRQSHRAIPSVPTFPAKLFVPTLPLPGISLPPPMPESSHPLAIKTLSAKNLPSPIETSAQCNFLSPSPREVCIWHPLPLQKVRKDNGELGAGLRGRCVPDTKRSQTHHPGASGSSWASPRKVDSGVGRGWPGRDGKEPLDKETSGGQLQALFLLPAPKSSGSLFQFHESS